MHALRFVLVLGACAALAACSDDSGTGPTSDGTGGGGSADDFMPPVSDVDSLFEGAPSNDELPEEGKFDATYPAQFDLVDSQSPVQSQGRRGVCSIFSTVALMEHLYILEGTIAEPDFSEQFLQWSAKVEVGAFTDTDGSNARSNLDAIYRFGIVLEDAWPYEPSGWGTTQDEACTGDDRPVRCYTNGEPPQAALDAQRFNLPRGRWIRSNADSIKAYMTTNGTAVITGVRFYYQAWNHGASELPTSSEYSAAGYVLSPNAEDRTDSEARPAGHSILLVGWDDDLSVQRRDGEGNLMVDEAGEPVMETGFFLFKNSWGTSRFGTQNPFGAGYGWISYDYVEEFGSVYGSRIPEVDLTEVCDNGGDDDLDGATDCDDTDCENANACNEALVVFEGEGDIAIPDNTPNGAASTLAIDATGTVEFARVSVDIEHTYRGDLEVAVVAPNGRRVVLHERSGGGEDDLVATYEPEALIGLGVTGTWTLEVSDTASADTGRIRGWSLAVVVGGDTTPEVCDDGVDNDANGQADCADEACIDAPGCEGLETVTATSEEALNIPDNDPDGDYGLLEVLDGGEIVDLAVDVDITHPTRSDLQVTLVHESGASVVLFDQEGGNEDDLVRRFETDVFDGLEAAGLWSLEVRDLRNLDSGTLNAWGLEITVR